MAKKKTKKQFGGITDKKDSNAGSGAFNRGSEQDPTYMDGVTGDQNDPKKSHKVDQPQSKQQNDNK